MLQSRGNPFQESANQFALEKQNCQLTSLPLIRSRLRSQRTNAVIPFLINVLDKNNEPLQIRFRKKQLSAVTRAKIKKDGFAK